MSDRGPALYRDKTVWRAGLAILGVPALYSIGATIALALGPDRLWALVPLFAAVVLTACTALFTVLRVVVSTREVHVQYGLFGPRIPVDSIVEVKVVIYDWTEFGGWGIKRSGDGTWAYSVMGKGKRAVRIAWTKDGEKHAAVVTSQDAEGLASAIEHARAAGQARPRVRVEVDEQDGTRAEHAEAQVEIDDGASRRNMRRR